jgi:hypothetical protein
MSSDIVFAAVHDFLAVQWTATPIAFENEPFVPPVTGGIPLPFIIVEVEGTQYDQLSIGSGASATDLWRESGAVIAHVMVRAGTGSLIARQLAMALATLLKGLVLPPSIRFQDLSIGAGQAGSEDGNYWCMTLRAEWIRD